MRTVLRHPCAIAFMRAHPSTAMARLPGHRLRVYTGLIALALPAVFAQQVAFMAPIHSEASQASDASSSGRGPTLPTVKTVGAIRVTENSGVCGAFADVPMRNKILTVFQRRHRKSIKHLDMRISPRIRASGTY